jgi:hypothetical protein
MLVQRLLRISNVRPIAGKNDYFWNFTEQQGRPDIASTIFCFALQLGLRDAFGNCFIEEFIHLTGRSLRQFGLLTTQFILLLAKLALLFAQGALLRHYARVEEYPVELSNVTILELIVVVPNMTGRTARASLRSLHLF